VELNEYQERALNTAIYPDAGGFSDAAINYCVVGLAAEAGSVANEWGKLLRDGKYDPEYLRRQIGDVLWYVANLAHSMGSSLDEIARSNLAKLASRQERGVLGGSGDER
jgi:NTP pyrophosphatase (non-canonical NTP hydrolase)